MTARGVPVQNLLQEELHAGDGREHAVAPVGIADLTTSGENGVGLPQRGPLAVNRWRMAVVLGIMGTPPRHRNFTTYTYRRCEENPNIYEVP